MQAEIIKNDMTNCRSPSAVLLSRIDKLKAQWPHTGAPGRPVAPTVAPRKAPGSAAPVSRVLPSTAPGGGHAAAQRVCGAEPESQRHSTSTGSTTEGNEGELGNRQGHGLA